VREDGNNSRHSSTIPPENRRLLELADDELEKRKSLRFRRQKTVLVTNTGDWQSEVAETPYVEIDGDRIVIHNSDLVIACTSEASFQL
jgi:hypothetical protein